MENSVPCFHEMGRQDELLFAAALALAFFPPGAFFRTVCLVVAFFFVGFFRAGDFFAAVFFAAVGGYNRIFGLPNILEA